MHNFPQQRNAYSILLFHLCQHAVMSRCCIIIPSTLNLSHLFQSYLMLQSSFLSRIKNVVFNSSKKQMVGSYAFAIVAVVTNEHSFWDWAALQFPRYTGRRVHPFRLSVSLHKKLSVTARTERGRPLIATVLLPLHFFPESFSKWAHRFFVGVFVTRYSSTSDRRTADMALSYSLFRSRNVAANLANTYERHAIICGQIFKHRTGFSAATYLRILFSLDSFIVRTSSHWATVSRLDAI